MRAASIIWSSLGLLTRPRLKLPSAPVVLVRTSDCSEYSASYVATPQPSRYALVSCFKILGMKVAKGIAFSLALTPMRAHMLTSAWQTSSSFT